MGQVQFYGGKVLFVAGTGQVAMDPACCCDGGMARAAMPGDSIMFVQADASARALCAHRGAETRKVECPTCGGGVSLKVFACALHGECTIAKQVDGLACCATCPDYEPPGHGQLLV